MNCRKVQSLMSAYVDCELSGLEMLAVRQHLSECCECKSESESLFRVKKALGSLCAKHPASDLVNRICSHLEQVTLPRGNLIVAAMRKHLTIFPARLGWAVVGMSVFAVLLMFRAGQMSTNQPMFTAALPNAHFIGMAEQGPIPLIQGVPAEFALFSAAPLPTPTKQPWELPKEPEGTLGSIGLTLTGYPK